MNELFYFSPAVACCLFYVVGAIKPRSDTRGSAKYFIDVAVLAGFAGLLITIAYYLWPMVPSLSLSGIRFDGVSNLPGQIISFYLIYSFGNYWLHRLKHRYLWWIHELHHAPAHLDSTLTYFRHPYEMALNMVYLVFVGKIVTDTNFTVLLFALCIEGVLESFHHANIQLPRWCRPIGYIVQTPEMHIAHHKKGMHSGNYSPLSIWDTVFFTVIIDIPLLWKYSDLGIDKYYEKYGGGRNEFSKSASKTRLRHRRYLKPGQKNSRGTISKKRHQ